MATLKFYVNKSRTNKLVSLHIRFRAGRKIDFKASTGKQINSKFFDNKKGKIKQRAEFKNGDQFKKEMDALRHFIIGEYNSNPDAPAENKDWLKEKIKQFFNPEQYNTKKTLFGFIEHFINNAGKRINPQTGKPISYRSIRKYHNTLNKLKDYARAINHETGKPFGEPDFNDIDLEFRQNFIDYLRSENAATNSIGKFIKTLKTFLNEATEQGINKNMKYKSSKFTALSEQVENIYLNHAEINQLYEYDFSDKPRLERVRDTFVVGCYTGLRYSDLSKLTKHHINGNTIDIRQKKTGNKVSIPLHPIVSEILDKYEGNMPKAISNQEFNDYLKEAAKLAGLNDTFLKKTPKNGMSIDKQYKKHELISSHTARRSFATNAYKDNIPTISIMAITGHKSENAFLQYIKASPKEHAQKFIDAWQKQGRFVRKSK